MKKSKRIFALLVVMMSLAFVPASFAEAEEISGNVWHDWDFEDSVAPAGWTNSNISDREIQNHEKYGKGLSLKSGKEASSFASSTTLSMLLDRTDLP